MRVIIDRFEEDFAICEKNDKTMIQIKKKKIPECAKEGDILIIEADSIKIAHHETAARKKTVESLMHDLWKR